MTAVPQLRNRWRCAGLRRVGGWGVLFAVLVSGAGAARAEQRLYHLRVTTPDGDRYETLSTEDPFTYASLVGGGLRVSRDYRRVWSPQVKVAVVATWIEHRVPLRAYWTTILRERGLLSARNHRLRQRRRPLTPAQMRVPEAVSPPRPATGGP